MLALDELGIADKIRERGEPIAVQELRSWHGATLQRVDVAALVSERGLPQPFIVRRSDLQAALAGALGDGVLERGSSCVAVQQDDDGVTLRMADGRDERARVVVGADGIASDVRTALLGRIEPRYAGYRYVHATSEHRDPSVPPGAFHFLLGRGDRFGIHAGDHWTLWFAVLRGPRPDDDAEAPHKPRLLDRFRSFDPSVARFIEGTAEDAIVSTDIEDLDPLDNWVDGRAVLVGDAAHASTPNLGRGVGDALEDAIVLADHLAAASDLAEMSAVTDALLRFERDRHDDATRVQRRARRIGKLTSWRNPVAVAARERIMRLAEHAVVKEMEEDFARFSEFASRRPAGGGRAS
jgi:2-polyprenyl-6-methoxyphenol hydroxylase-like FAD-dependent oxidoreductase